MRGKEYFILFLILIAGLFIRLFLSNKFIDISGDLLLYADWGKRLVEEGSRNFYYLKDWYYAPPNYPPLVSLIYGGSFYLFEQKHLLLQLHRIVRLYPSEFIEFFYGYGYFLLLKLPGILADIGLGVLIYHAVFSLTKNVKKALVGAAFYVLNPVTIFLSSIWGQTDSLVGLFGILAFLTLIKKKFILAIIFITISLLIKPNWVYLLPIFIYLLIKLKPRIKEIILGIVASFTIVILGGLPFSKYGIFNFYNFISMERIIPTSYLAHKASVSAFNLHSAMFKLDITPDSIPIFGIPLNILSLMVFIVLYVFVFLSLRNRKIGQEEVYFSLFTIGFGAYFVLTNMLERYFFAGFAPMIILMFSRPRMLIAGIFLNAAVLVNILHSYFRRSVGFIADIFLDNNMALVRAFSILGFVSWIYSLKVLSQLPLENEK